MTYSRPSGAKPPSPWSNSRPSGRGRRSGAGGRARVGTRGGSRAGYSATTKVNRSDFGLTWNQVLETGGIAVVNQNDFDRALKRIDAETSDYYVLGYYSSNPDPLKRTRRIEVKARRDGVQVWSRTSYTLRPLPAQ